MMGDYTKMDENDVVVDHGSFSYSRPADEADIAGHRAVFVGIHMPLKNKGHHKHRHKHRHHRNGKDKGSTDDVPNTDPSAGTESPLLKNHSAERKVSDEPKNKEQPSQRVKFILGGESNTPDEEHQSHEVFTELEELYTSSDGDGLEWKETARWIKYEEDVDEGASRWSKPHIATLSLHSLFELRSALLNGSVCLDLDADNLFEIADLVLEKLILSGQLDPEKREQVREALLQKHHHHGERKHKKSLMPMIRTLTDIGRSLSSSAGHHTSMEQAAEQMDKSHKSSPNFQANQSNKSNSLTVEDGSNGSLVKVASAPSMRARSSFMRKIPEGAEASNVLVGEVDFLARPIIAFVRLLHSVHLGDLTEVPIPTRFIFIMLGPTSEDTNKYHEIGRCIATLMSDEVFHDVAYKAKSTDDLLAGIDEFMDQVTVLPPGVWDPNIRIEPPKTSPPPQTKRLEGFPLPANGSACTDGPHDGHGEHEGLERSGRLFGGLVADIKRRVPRYFSDFRDALHVQCLAAFIFMYFACITPVVTFGGLLGEATDNQISTLESLLGAAMCGIAFSLFAGQPLTILGSTGPILVYEKIMFGVCSALGWQYLPFRFWVGIWTCLLCIVLVAIDASTLVKYFTRFVEESFSALISFIFIYEALHKVEKIYHDYPVEKQEIVVNSTPVRSSLVVVAALWLSWVASFSLSFNTCSFALSRHPYTNPVEYNCSCVPSNKTEYFHIDDIANMTSTVLSACKRYKGDLIGTTCDHSEPVSDIFLMSVVLFVGTFTIAYSLKGFKTARYFPTLVRSTISDFSVFLAVVLMVGLDWIMGVHTPKLPVPNTFEPTFQKRKTWFLNPLYVDEDAEPNPWYSCLLAFLPALLATILIFMDQQITAVIVNRKENKLKKGVGYHLDLLVVALMLGLCSIMGLPWFVAATVLSINHVNSLRVESKCKAPGERPKVVGCREQRVTGTVVFIFIGLAVFMTPLLILIPMPVLYGVFLYMGVSSLKGVQFVDRLSLFLMPAKHQPDYTFLRNVELWRVHLFTFIQLMCLVALWVIKMSKAALIFPIMVLAMVFIRKLMECFFSKHVLENLDDVMPEVVKKDRHDREKQEEEAAQAAATMSLGGNCGGRVQLPLSGGNVLSIPVDKVEFHPDSGTVNISDEMARCGIWKTIAENAQSETHMVHRKRKEGNVSTTPHLETIPGSPHESRHFEIGGDSPDGSINDIRIEVPVIKTPERGDSETSV